MLIVDVWIGSSSPACDELQEEEVRAQQPAAAEEEDQVVVTRYGHEGREDRGKVELLRAEEMSRTWAGCHQLILKRTFDIAVVQARMSASQTAVLQDAILQVQVRPALFTFRGQFASKPRFCHMVPVPPPLLPRPH